MTHNLLVLVEKKLEFYKDVIQNTIFHVQKNKNLDILGIKDVTNCIEKLGEISKKIEEIKTIDVNQSDILTNNLQLLNNNLSSVLKSYGTHNLEDLLTICLGNVKIANNQKEYHKFELLKKYFHPTSYNVSSLRENKRKRKIKQHNSQNNENLDEDHEINLSCSDVISIYKQFHMRVYGAKLYIYCESNRKMIIHGIFDDVIISFLNNSYINEKIKNLKNNIPDDERFQSEIFEIFVSSLSLKDLLIYDTNEQIYNKFIGNETTHELTRQKQIPQLIKDFISDDIYYKRNTLINLLIHSSKYDNLYLAYLLYDILSNDNNGHVDSLEQSIILDSFPYIIKENFKKAMKKTIEYTNELTNFNINKIPLEQQICLLKAPDNVKEKAMAKLKEIKSKSEDTGSKARQYLDGLLKIPFGIYRKELILNIMENIRNKFKDLCKTHNISQLFSQINNKEKYTSIEVLKYLKNIQIIYNDELLLNKIVQFLTYGNKNEILSKIYKLETIYEEQKINFPLKYANLNKKDLCKQLEHFAKNITELKHNIFDSIIKEFNIFPLYYDVKDIQTSLNYVNNYMKEIKNTLDMSVYGHDSAKRQIERILGQWINGEQCGHCFGFEGPPGVGKTSLAKYGLSLCLKDNDGNPRPFAMIQMGGDCNGSTLNGHNYTYVGSTWGSIVQILIDKKCMNPIIFIDEVDKISRTENGKEIVGILTHLLDTTQNDCFQDKYFSGIDLDLSKALFVLSYNDPELIDRILLDRIHRVKFSHLTIEDKIVICNKHLLPEIYKKMGMEDMIVFEDEILKFIIEEYTYESGVRKLKEVLFEIIGEINLDILKNGIKVDENNEEVDLKLPMVITIEDIKNKYFKDKHEIKHKKIHDENKIGIINGLWANNLGKGGVIPIQVSWRPCDKFLSLHLTGMQGDVMKESMNVAFTLAWSLTDENIRTNISTLKTNGIHIHCPEGATPKDGPSAGTAITTAIYSLLNGKKIKHDVAITGEICLNGNVTEIGGLDLKIIGAIKAGVKEIIFPNDNLRDYNNLIEKYKDTLFLNNIKFYSVKNIQEVFKLVFE
jgi:endopeptidase La